MNKFELAARICEMNIIKGGNILDEYFLEGYNSALTEIAEVLRNAAALTPESVNIAFQHLICKDHEEAL